MRLGASGALPTVVCNVLDRTPPVPGWPVGLLRQETPSTALRAGSSFVRVTGLPVVKAGAPALTAISHFPFPISLQPALVSQHVQHHNVRVALGVERQAEDLAECIDGHGLGQVKVPLARGNVVQVEQRRAGPKNGACRG